MTSLPTLYDIRQAAERLADRIIRTPLVPAPRLAERFGLATLHLKLESLQYTGSFKDRGAYLKLRSLPSDQATRGVIAMSAGNHAQGVAYHAKRLGIPATIVMPEATPFTKIERTAALGAQVILSGETIDEAALAALKLAADERLAFIHPYDDPLIVAGQGTIGLEIMQDLPDFDCLLAPIGGGGLISGIALAVKASRPMVEIIGVEAKLYPSMHNAVKNLPAANGGQTLADGIAVKSPGVLNKAIIERFVDDILLVAEEQIEYAVYLLSEIQRVVAEGAGAAVIAALLAKPERFAGKRLVAIISGGNIDSRLLAQVLTRGLMRDGRLATLRVEISDSPGVLATVSGLIGKLGGNIIEIHHQRMFFNLPVKRADLDIVIETRNARHVEEIIAALEKAGFITRRMENMSR